MNTTHHRHGGRAMIPFSGRSQIAVLRTWNPRADLRSAAKREGTAVVRRHLSAFTLIEMVVSLTIVSIVFLAMGSVMMLATKAVPSPDDPVNQMIENADILEQITSELQTATTITAATDKGIAFTVPDRDADGADEVIQYAWAGVAGEPLYRQYNGGNMVAVMPAVSQFELVYQYTVSSHTPMIESAEIEFSKKTGAQDLKNYSITQSKWIGQYFVPSNLPADAVGWSVTRVQVKASYRGGTAGQTLVQLRPAAVGNLPDAAVLDQATMFESDLSSSSTWQEFSFSGVRDIAPNQGLCLVLQWVNDTQSANVSFDAGGGTGRLITSDGGLNWTHNNGKSMLHYVYGTYTTPGNPVSINTLRSISVALAPSDDPASQARTSVIALNEPQMP